MSNFKAKIHQIRFRLGFRPRPRWGSLAGFKGPYILVREGSGGKGKEGM